MLTFCMHDMGLSLLSWCSDLYGSHLSLTTSARYNITHRWSEQMKTISFATMYNSGVYLPHNSGCTYGRQICASSEYDRTWKCNVTKYCHTNWEHTQYCHTNRSISYKQLSHKSGHIIQAISICCVVNIWHSGNTYCMQHGIDTNICLIVIIYTDIETIELIYTFLNLISSNVLSLKRYT